MAEFRKLLSFTILINLHFCFTLAFVEVGESGLMDQDLMVMGWGVDDMLNNWSWVDTDCLDEWS